jgi:outer membrane protein
LEEMKKTIWIAALFLTIWCQKISAQQKEWTLEDCISYAVTNNLGLQRQMLQTETAQTNLLKSRMELLPSLNFGSDAQMGFDDQ